MIWDDPEERRKKKIRKAAKSAASAGGGGVALWFFSLLYPRTEESEGIAALLADLALPLVLYALVVLGFILFKEKLALKVYVLMSWIVLPSYVVYLLMRAAQ